MIEMHDAATPPRDFPDGEVWAGYLHSPSAAAPWPQTALRAAAAAGGLLPIYVAPISPAGYASRHGAADADDAVAQLRALHLDRIVIALDTEPGAFSSSRRASLAYAVAFNRRVHHLGGVTIHYGSTGFLKALGSRARLSRPRSRLAWLAWWTTAGSWPKELARWPHPRAWQYDHDKPHAGTNTDPSRIDDDLPICRPATHPAPAPVDPADRQLAAELHHWLRAKGL